MTLLLLLVLRRHLDNLAGRQSPYDSLSAGLRTLTWSLFIWSQGTNQPQEKGTKRVLFEITDNTRVTASTFAAKEISADAAPEAVWSELDKISSALKAFLYSRLAFPRCLVQLQAQRTTVTLLRPLQSWYPLWIKQLVSTYHPTSKIQPSCSFKYCGITDAPWSQCRAHNVACDANATVGSWEELAEQQEGQNTLFSSSLVEKPNKRPLHSVTPGATRRR